MKVHHLNAATLCPYGGRWFGGEGPPWTTATLVCHCLLIETEAHGLVLVDTGFGREDIAHARARLGLQFVLMCRPQFDRAQALVEQIEQLGFHAADVRHIVLTHLDCDHAGGLADFPHATVHVLADEHDAAVHRRSYLETHRYRPIQWQHGPQFQLYRADGERWRGAPCVRDLVGLPPEILLVPMTGHSRGHACVAVEVAGHALLHAGDAYFHRHSIEGKPVPRGLAHFERTVAIDRDKIAGNHARLREWAEGAEVRVFSAHDPLELERLRR